MFIENKEILLMHIINEMHTKPWHYQKEHPQFNTRFSYAQIAAEAPNFGRFITTGKFFNYLIKFFTYFIFLIFF